MWLLRCTITVLLVFFAGRALGEDRNALPDAKAGLQGAALVHALRAGGFTLFFRHGATEPLQTDRDPVDFAACDSQRNLSDAGRRDARAIDSSVASLGVKVSEVIASPYCRTMETARLIAGRASASQDALGHMTHGKPDYRALDRIVATPPPRGTVRIVVSHSHVFRAMAGLPFLSEGEAAVIRPHGDRWTIVARVQPADWATLPR